MTSVDAGSGPSGTAASHPYTCNTCQVAYRNSDLQKTHMKSDWHRYNLKRRVTSLPPISSEIFYEKVLQARAVTSAEANKAYFERTCDSCNKTYSSENAFSNHLLSHKHKQSLVAAPPLRADDETTSVVSSTFSLGEPTIVAKDALDSDAENEFNQVVESLQKSSVTQQRPSPVKRPSNPHFSQADAELSKPDVQPNWSTSSCIFCNYTSPSITLNVDHMERFHGMFIPERPYLVNLEGLIAQLQQQVSEHHECLGCGKVKSTVFAVQTHMRDKGHCLIPYTTEAEQLKIGDFYDFRSTYTDDEYDDDDESNSGQTSEADHGGAKLGSKRCATTTDSHGQLLDESGDADGWETDTSVSSLDSADLTAVPAEGHIHQFERLSRHPHHSHHDPRNRHQVDGWHSRAHKHTHAVFYDDYELHLPSGKSVGHRSLNRYFRQNLHNYPTPEERAQRLALEAAPLPESDLDPCATVLGGQLLPRGMVGMVGVSSDKKRQVRKAEHRARDAARDRTRKNDLAYGRAANNQKTYYYRYDGGG
ncbi:hypothetical protein CDD81_7265 [Ophiocordyceps australis]|uniref:C2H2-type domain-containing protein n=1 Tax=Ophiocordyceps australis TaxID=1399860 RepID=A0A2C5Y0R1_9HYPO|nr:hypothetical protein CDD81_7265 [Ophiocordyceps australis]